MKDKENWLSKFKLEEVSTGLEDIGNKLNRSTVCLHTSMKYGIPDSLTVYLITHFNDLGMKKLIITDFPIPEEPEEWTELLEGQRYVIEKVPSNFSEKHDCHSIAIEQFLAKHREPFRVRDNSNKIAHIETIKTADVVMGFPSSDILEPYVKMLEKYNKFYIIGGYVTEDNFSDYLEVFKMRKFEITAVTSLRVKEFLCECNGSLIWMDNFDKKASLILGTDSRYEHEFDEM